MKRREFIAASCLAGLAPLGGAAAAQDSTEGGGKQYFELRLVRLASKEKQKGLVDFLGDAAIPAMNRLGIGPVGVFSDLEDESQDVYILMPHKSLESVATMTAQLGADDAFRQAGADFLDAPHDDPAYDRIESSLMIAFDGMPKVATPAKGDKRVFQLRIYESHSIAIGQRKIEMFNDGGELEIFDRTGLTPVFFGETLIGSKMPNLTYMLGFDTMEAGKEAWAKFLKDPGWEKLKTDPYYKNTVSNITNLFLRPAACSQI